MKKEEDEEWIVEKLETVQYGSSPFWRRAISSNGKVPKILRIKIVL
jgi:hypothetical protein